MPSDCMHIMPLDTLSIYGSESPCSSVAHARISPTHPRGCTSQEIARASCLSTQLPYMVAGDHTHLLRVSASPTHPVRYVSNEVARASCNSAWLPHMAARALAHLPRKSASPRHARGYIYATRLHAHRASRHRFLIWQLEPMLLCRPTAHLLYASAWADTPDVCTHSTWIHYIAVKAHAQLCRECVRIPLLRTCVGVCQEVTRASCLSTWLPHMAA